jgi:DNA-binding NtrC family response regulator
MENILEGKRILIADDEPDILETVTDLLDMCINDTAPSFETAQKFLSKNTYDAAVLDIMGVEGYQLLKITTQKGIPSLMLTAHALSPDDLVKSIKEGAYAYIPKDKIGDIDVYLADIIKTSEKGIRKQGIWFARLKQFFDKKFGPGWQEEHKEFWQEFDKSFIVSKEEVEKVL